MCVITLMDVHSSIGKEERHMWGVVDDSAEDPMSELWGLFKSDDDVSWQHKALCSQTDPEAFFPEKGGSTRDAKQPAARCASNACNGPSNTMSVSASGAA